MYKDFLNENFLYLLITVGDSNGSGYSFQPLPNNYDNLAVNNNKKVAWNDETTEMVVVDNFNNGITSNDRIYDRIRVPVANMGVANQCVMMANQMSTFIQDSFDKNIQFITINAAYGGGGLNPDGGYTVVQMDKGHDPFMYLVQAIQVAKNYADSIGKTLFVPYIWFHEGIWDVVSDASVQMTLEKKKAALNKYWFDLFLEIRKINRQKYIPKIYRMQVNAQNNTDAVNSKIKQIQIDLESMYFPLAMASYHLSILSAFNHFVTNSIFKISGCVCETIFQREYSGVDKRVSIASISSTSSSQITVTANKPLLIDTSKGTSVNTGFVVYDASDVEVPITAVVIDGNSVKITAPNGPGYKVGYQHKRPWLSPYNPERPISYVRGTAVTEFYEFPIHYVLPSFFVTL